MLWRFFVQSSKIMCQKNWIISFQVKFFICFIFDKTQDSDIDIDDDEFRNGNETEKIP